MKLIAWSSGLSVHIEEIDEEHRKIIDCINVVHEALLREDAPEVVGQVVDELLDYAAVHFTHEEALLRENGFPEFDSHRALHQDFESKVEGFRRDIANGDTKLLAEALLDFLSDWLEQHILNADQHYVDYLNSRGIS